MTAPDIILLAFFLTVIAMYGIAVWRNWRKNRVIAEGWEKQKKEKPEEFLSDDDWVFVEHKGMMMPLRAIEKRERWDKFNRHQKGEAVRAVRNALNKGHMEEVIGDDGKPYFIPTGNSKLRKAVSDYQKVREATTDFNKHRKTIKSAVQKLKK